MITSGTGQTLTKFAVLLMHLGSSVTIYEHAASVTSALPVCVVAEIPGNLEQRADPCFLVDRAACPSEKRSEGCGENSGIISAESPKGASPVWYHCACVCGTCAVAVSSYLAGEPASLFASCELWGTLMLPDERGAWYLGSEILRPPRL